MQLTKGMAGNLISRYRVILKNCTLINLFGSLAFATMLVVGTANVGMAVTNIAIDKDTVDNTIDTVTGKLTVSNGDGADESEKIYINGTSKLNVTGLTTLGTMAGEVGNITNKNSEPDAVKFQGGLKIFNGTYTNEKGTTDIGKPAVGSSLQIMAGTYNNGEDGTTTVVGQTIFMGVNAEFDNEGTANLEGGLSINAGKYTNTSGDTIITNIASSSAILAINSGSYINAGGTTTVNGITNIGVTSIAIGTFINSGTGEVKFNGALNINNGTYTNNTTESEFGEALSPTSGTTITGSTTIGAGAKFINKSGDTSFNDLTLSAAAAGGKLTIDGGDVRVKGMLTMAAGSTVTVGGVGGTGEPDIDKVTAKLTFEDLHNSAATTGSLSINYGGLIEVDKGVVFTGDSGAYTIAADVLVNSFTINSGGILKITGYENIDLSEDDLGDLKDLLANGTGVNGLINIDHKGSGVDICDGHFDYVNITDRDITNTEYQESITDVLESEATIDGIKGAFAGLHMVEFDSGIDGIGGIGTVEVHETLILTGNEVTYESSGETKYDPLVTDKDGNKNIANFNVNDGALTLGNRKQNNSGEIGNVNLGTTDGNFSTVGNGGDASETSFTIGDITGNGNVSVSGTNMITGAIGAVNGSDNIDILVNNGSLVTVSNIIIGTGGISVLDSDINVGNIDIASGNITVKNSGDYKSSIKELNLGIASDDTKTVKAIFTGEASFTEGANLYSASSLEIDTLAQTTNATFAAIGKNSYISVGEVTGNGVSTFTVGEIGEAGIAGEYGILSFGTMSKDIIQAYADKDNFDPTRVVAVNKPVDLSKVAIHAGSAAIGSGANVEIGDGALLIVGWGGVPIFETSGSVEKTVNLADGSGLLMSADNGIKPGTYILTGDNIKATVGDIAYAGTDSDMFILGVDGVKINANDQLLVTVRGKDAVEIAREHPYIDSGIVNFVAEMVDNEGINYNAVEGGYRFISRWSSSKYGSDVKSADQSLQSAVDSTSASAVPQVALSISNSTAAISTARTSFVASSFAGENSTSVTMNEDSITVSGLSSNQNMKNGIGIWFAPMYQNQQAYGYSSGEFDTGYSSYFLGGVFGADYTMNNAFRIGASLSVGAGQAKSTGERNDTTNDFNYYGLGLYAGYQFNKFGLLVDFGYSSNNSEIDQDQPVNYGGNFEADTSSRTLTVGLRGEYKFTSEFVDIIPHISARMTNIYMDSYDMQNAFGTVVKLGSTSNTVWTFPVGVTFAKDIETSGGWTIQPQLDLTITPAAGDIETKQDIRFTGVSGTIVSKDDIMDYLSYGGGLGLNLMKDDLSIGLNYTLQASEHITSHGVQFTFRLEF